MTIKNDALDLYTVTFTIVAEGGSTTTASFNFEIICGFPIREFPLKVPQEDPALNPITLTFPTSENGHEEYTLDAYKLTGGLCKIQQYILDNDDDRTTLFQEIPGVDSIQSVAPLPCDGSTTA